MITAHAPGLQSTGGRQDRTRDFKLGNVWLEIRRKIDQMVDVVGAPIRQAGPMMAEQGADSESASLTRSPAK
jgi:hypothetical protein